MSLYSEYFYSKDINNLLSERQTIAQMLRFEGALALAQAENDIIPLQSAEIIDTCCQVDFIDIDKLKSEIKLGGNAAIPLVKQLTRIVKNNDVEASKYVHLGATSQDVVDTATVLQMQEYWYWLNDKLVILQELLTDLTKKHRETLMIGRTLLQQARPITFGLKTAGWLQSISRSKDRLKSTQKRALMLQLVGAVGSGNANISKSVQLSLANILDLKPAFSWQSNRDTLVEAASVFALLNQSLGKMAKDISLLMQTEIAEVFEGAGEGKGGSSTMPHKRNPVTCAAIIANAARVPHLVASLYSAMPQEHERSAGLWHAEWEVLSEIMLLTAGSIERAIELMESLEVDRQRMLLNLELTKGLIYAENVSLALATKIGKINAHELVEKACKSAISQQKHLKEILEEMNIDLPNLEALFKPENSIGNSLEMIDEILN
ncbi:3-carboxy-cis,cis-muconate cycloisomerase [Emticicia oligotrophica DSM 17448]|uniref:3-carboxy-cis,cis-muconate cycloisomerase n=1 Tax=Emticicia oligotrophica (strain DSM 17448 / CIP 109782 / MTCC 6937 / GPTSA100-15) TaxID=929562 RepID=A0ABM5MZT1_EMTOG|nr:3-carboxy-cis,cis-muconate cycloisomerase [Emticicia oligotrophica]AFK02725.1 3-carboxy-cis,cis-muconate cycloisomerase [Emticicia oligotrophica DSM 17448]